MNDEIKPNSGQESPDQTESDLQQSIGLRQSDRLFLIVMSATLLIVSGLHLIRMVSANDETIEIVRDPAAYTFKIDVNDATWVEWMQLDGIGETTARKIVLNRQELGPFVAIDDVTRVPGIGPKTLEKMRLHLRCEECQ